MDLLQRCPGEHVMFGSGLRRKDCPSRDADPFCGVRASLYANANAVIPNERTVAKQAKAERDEIR
jgi:hypothetical protein